MKLILILISTLILDAHEPEDYRNMAMNLAEFAFQKTEYDERKKLLKEATNFSYGKGPEIYVFADPACIYSKMLFKSNRLLGWRVNVILMDVGQYKDSKKLISHILEKDSRKRFFQIVNGDSHEYNQTTVGKAEEQIDKIKKISKYIKITGTPNITDYAGRGIEIFDGTYAYK